MRQAPERLVFIDETSVKPNLTRRRGRSPIGNRLYGAAPFGSWNSQTFIAGLTSKGMIAPWVIKGAMDGPAFETCIRTQLAPELELSNVVIPDNFATQRNAAATQALKDRGCWFVVVDNRPLEAFLFPQTPAALQPRPEPHTNGVFQAQGTSAQDRGKDIRSTLRSNRGYLRHVQPARVLELLSGHKICLKLNAK